MKLEAKLQQAVQTVVGKPMLQTGAEIKLTNPVKPKLSKINSNQNAGGKCKPVSSLEAVKAWADEEVAALLTYFPPK